MDASIHKYIHIHIYGWIYINLCICVYIYTDTYIHIYVYRESMWVYVYMCISLYIYLFYIYIYMHINRNAILLDQRAGFLFIHRTVFATLIPHAPILLMAVHWEQNVSWYCTRDERSWIYHTWRLYKLLVHLTSLPLGIEGALCVKPLQTCPTLCDPTGCSSPCSSIRGIFPGKNTGVGCCPPGDLPKPEIKPMSLTSSALAGRFFTTSVT